MRHHLANQVRLEKEGIMFDGPLFGRDSDAPQAGMIVIRANSFEEADEIAQRDPLHSRDLRIQTLQKWRINEEHLHADGELFGPERQDLVESRL